MRIVVPTLDIGELEGFTPEKDIFGRAGLGQGLTNLVATVDAPMVVAVDGQWGSGKTVMTCADRRAGTIIARPQNKPVCGQ